MFAVYGQLAECTSQMDKDTWKTEYISHIALTNKVRIKAKIQIKKVSKEKFAEANVQLNV